jgi:hypothetical protein
MIRWNWVGFLPTCILFVIVFPCETLTFVCRFDLFFVEREQRLLAFSASHVNKQGTRNRIYFFSFVCSPRVLCLSFTSKVATAANNNKRSAAAMVRFEFAFISARETSRARVLF